MTRIITPAIFLSASILAGRTAEQAPAQPGTDELAGANGQDGEAPMSATAHDHFGFMAVENTGAFDCGDQVTGSPTRSF